MSIDTTGNEPPKRPKMARGEREARARQAAQSKSRAADSPSNWSPWPLETHLKKGQLDMVVNGTLPLPPNPKPGSNFPIIRDVHGPLEQLDRLISDLEQTGVIDRAAFERMAEILSLIYRGDHDPTWGESRRMIARMCLAIGESEPDEPDEPDWVDLGYGRDGDDDEAEREEKKLPPMTVGPESWPEKWDPKDAAAAGQGNIEL